MMNGSSVPKASLILAAVVALLAGGAYLFQDQREPSPSGSAVRDVIEAPKPRLAEATPGRGTDSAAAALPSASAPTRHPMAVGMTSSNPLAFVTEMRQKGGPGAYAMAEQVTYECREALKAMREFSDPDRAALRKSQQAANVGREGAALAAQAMAVQTIEARCGPFANPLESDDPKADDAAAKAYQAAFQALLDWKPLEAALKELAEQGQLQAAAVALRARLQPPSNAGGSSSEDRDLFARAMTVAAFNASTDPAHPSDDLRAMSLCLYGGRCDGSYESEMLARWPEGSPQREKAKAWIAQLESAFASNDYRAFLPGKKKGS